MAPHSRFTRLSPSPDFEAGSGAVGVATVHEGNDLDDEALIDDPVDHAVLTTPGREQRGKGLTQRLADLARIMAEGSHDELKGRCRDFLGEFPLQGTSGRTAEDDLVRFGHSVSARGRRGRREPRRR